MTTTLSSKKTERLEQILSVSAQLFARHGYHGTSTREIARVVGIAENTLFRYFEHKEEIFWAALDLRLDQLRISEEIVRGIAGSDNPEVVLPQLIAQLVDTAMLNPELLRLLSVAFLELPWKASEICRGRLSPAFLAVAGYLKSSIERGRIRNLDPRLMATAMGMTVLAHFELAKFGGSSPAIVDNREIIAAHSKFWLGVLIPDAQSPLIAAGAAVR